MSPDKKSGQDTPFGIVHQEMLVEGEKLKELDEEEGIKIQREQRKIKLGEEGEKELKGMERKESL